MNEGNGYVEDRNLIKFQLAEMRRELKEVKGEVHTISNAVLTLKLQSRMRMAAWGSLGGTLGAVVTAVLIAVVLSRFGLR